VFSFDVFGQQQNLNKHDNLFSLVSNKVDSFLINDALLLNGRFFIVKYPHAKGNPYIENINGSTGKIVLAEREYNNVRLIYDIWEQKLNLLVDAKENEGFILELVNENVLSFILGDRVFFNCLKLPILPQSGFYEEIFVGKHLKAYAQLSKNFINTTSDNYIGEFSNQKKSLFIVVNEKNVEITNNLDFMKLFGSNRKKVKPFIKKNKIRLTKSNNNDLVKLFQFVELLL
jgi:hypothetical protein